MPCAGGTGNSEAGPNTSCSKDDCNRFLYWVKASTHFDAFLRTKVCAQAVAGDKYFSCFVAAPSETDGVIGELIDLAYHAAVLVVS